MKVLEKIQEYICGKENLMLAREDLKEIYGKNFVEDIVEKETKYLCSFFDDNKSYEVPFNDFVLLSRIFENTKLNYREMGKVLAFVLNQNAKLIESLSAEQLVSYTFLANGNPVNNEAEKDIVIERFKNAPVVIRNYINEDGSFKPVQVNELDKECLKSMIFILSDKQVDTILFFCQKEYDERHKPEFVVKPKVVVNEEKAELSSKEVKILKKRLKDYIDDSGHLIKVLNEEELLDVFSIIEKLKFHELECWKSEIIKQNQKLIDLKHEDEKHEEESIFLEKLSEIRLECLKEHELLTYDYAMQILVNKEFAYPVIKDDIGEQINDIDQILREILQLKEESEKAVEFLGDYANWSYEKSKAELIELMSLSFQELSAILDNYVLIENPFKLERL